MPFKPRRFISSTLWRASGTDSSRGSSVCGLPSPWTSARRPSCHPRPSNCRCSRSRSRLIDHQRRKRTRTPTKAARPTSDPALWISSSIARREYPKDCKAARSRQAAERHAENRPSTAPLAVWLADPALSPAHRDRSSHAPVRVVPYRAVPAVLPGLVQAGPEGGGLAGLDLLCLNEAARPLHAQRVNNVASVLNLELDNARLLDRGIRGGDLHLGLFDVDRRDGRATRGIGVLP